MGGGWKGKSPRGRLSAILVLCLLSLLPARLASAAFEDRYGYSARAMALANAFAALADGPCATFYNPAALGQVERSMATLGFIYGHPAIVVEDRESGRKVESDIRDQNQLVLGLVANAAPDFGDLRFGLAAALPSEFLANIPLQRSADPQFINFSRTQEPIVEAALGYRILPWLSLGAGLDVFLGVDLEVEAEAPVVISTGGGALIQVDIPAEVTGGKSHIPYVIAPTAGLHLAPTRELRIGIAFRDTLEIPVRSAIAIRIPGTGPLEKFPLPFEIRWNALLRPRQVSAGFSYRLPRDVTLALELTWYNWSSLSRTQISVMRREGLFVPLGEDYGLLEVTFGTVVPEPEARDVFVPRIGLEWQALPALALRAGYYYDASAFKNVSDETNYLEPARHVFSTGCGFTAIDPMGIGDPGKRFLIDAYFQYQALTDESTLHFRSEGYAISLGATASYIF